MEEETIRAVANATKAVAELGTSATELVSSSGRFVADLVGGPLHQVAGLLEDRLRYVRRVRWERLQLRLREELLALGQGSTVKPLPLSFGIDALEAAAFEEDDSLQDMWARLIANASDARLEVAPQRAFISVLKDFSSLDALNFEQIYKAEASEPGTTAFVTRELPARAYRASPNETAEKLDPPPDVVLSLSNLVRLGCIAFGSSWGGAEIFYVVNTTRSGLALYQAIQRRGIDSPVAPQIHP
ncbi:Abi-alpha family protein [Pseudorhodoferax sp.]|uniref:Abi-alpha family protein n=1 Tax=Pseudorhodoferax sp. TaxID=1993553 RepID=UPI002DD6A6A3|nr:Abi-alpha family protein [Pseudorhodoferax sp.]